MNNSLVYATIRRSNRKLLIWCAIGALLLIGFAAYNIRYLYNFVLGPTAIDRQMLLATKDPSTLPRYWVTVEGDDVVDTGFQQVLRRDSGSETVEASYMALLLDQDILLVKAQDEKSVTKYTGYLEVPSSDVREQIIADAESENPDLHDAFLPYLLNTDSFRGRGYVGLGIGIPVLLLLLYGIFRALQRISDPFAHPILRALGRFGMPADIAGQIDSELLADHPTLGQLHLTPSWLVQATSTSLAATRIADVAWAYKRVTQHRTNGIPTGKTYAANIWDRHGVCITFAGKEAFVDQVLTSAAQHAPWMLAGFSADIEKAWKADRNSVLATVDQRRQQIMAQR